LEGQGPEGSDELVRGPLGSENGKKIGLVEVSLDGIVPPGSLVVQLQAAAWEDSQIPQENSGTV